MAGDLTTVTVKFPPDDLLLLEALERVERLRRSDVIRRAVRAYAEKLGVTEDQSASRRRRKA